MPEREPIVFGSMREAMGAYFGQAGVNALEQKRSVEPENEDQPMLHGWGPPEFSTCTALTPRPVVCWDVNRYYRDLGVHWRATKKELRIAFQAHGVMPSARITYIFKQLLNDEVRREYDNTPLGGLFLDEYVREELQRRATLMAAVKRARGEESSAESILDEMGFHLLPPEPDEAVDTGLEDDEDDVALEAGPTQVWPWGFYLWKTRKIDESRLRRWQELLVSEFGQRGVVTRLAVGLHGSSAHPWLIAAVGYRTVVFLHRDHQPTVEAAAAVVDRVELDTQQDTSVGSRKAIA